MKKYPKVLILLETFHDQSGGGITLSNLFKDWEKSCIANAANLKEIGKVTNFDRCNNLYVLGEDENKIVFPFSIFIKYGKSGQLDLKIINQERENKKSNLRKIIKFLKGIFFRDAVSFSNVIGTFFSLHISRKFLNWVNDFAPDFLYVQPGSLESIRFFTKLHEVTGIPLVVHIMDDWTNVIGNGPLQYFRAKKINTEFRQLLGATTIFLSISDGMSKEYLDRYGKSFTSFHNTIEIGKWLPFSKKEYEISNEIRILYAGRIGLGTYHAFLDLILAIQELNNEGKNICIHIQTPHIDKSFREKLNQFKFVKFNPFVEYSDLPKIFSGYDLLLLPIDFQNKGQTFLKFSMPTKVPEFMISGIPILLYCPKNVYLHSHALINGWAYIIDENKMESIKNGVLDLINHKDIREKIGKRAMEYAINNYGSDIVREKFRLMFCNNVKTSIEPHLSLSEYDN